MNRHTFNLTHTVWRAERVLVIAMMRILVNAKTEYSNESFAGNLSSESFEHPSLSSSLPSEGRTSADIELKFNWLQVGRVKGSPSMDVSWIATNLLSLACVRCFVPPIDLKNTNCILTSVCLWPYMRIGDPPSNATQRMFGFWEKNVEDAECFVRRSLTNTLQAEYVLITRTTNIDLTQRCRHFSIICSVSLSTLLCLHANAQQRIPASRKVCRFRNQINNYESDTICTTCHEDMKNEKVSRTAANENLR